MEKNIQELIKQYAQTGDRRCMVEIVEELQNRETLWVAYSPVTKNHYMEYQNGIPTAFLFSDPDYCEAFREHLASKKVRMNTLENARSARVTMFSDFFRNGIEQIMIDNGQTYIIVNMKDIIKQPDFSSLPEDERPLLNRSLMTKANL